MTTATQKSRSPQRRIAGQRSTSSSRDRLLPGQPSPSAPSPKRGWRDPQSCQNCERPRNLHHPLTYLARTRARRCFPSAGGLGRRLSGPCPQTERSQPMVKRCDNIHQSITTAALSTAIPKWPPPQRLHVVLGTTTRVGRTCATSSDPSRIPLKYAHQTRTPYA